LAKIEALHAELKQDEEALTQAKEEESQLLDMLKDLQQERDAQAQKALQMKKRLNPIEGSAGEDTKEIEAANQNFFVQYRPSKLY
jgi:hypothetical protein